MGRENLGGRENNAWEGELKRDMAGQGRSWKGGRDNLSGRRSGGEWVNWRRRDNSEKWRKEGEHGRKGIKNIGKA